jgi:hypothetical protein
MNSAIRSILAAVGIASYAGLSGGLPLYLHVFLAHSGPCHSACAKQTDATGGFRSGKQGDDTSPDPANCPTCDQLIRTAAKPVVIGPMLVWDGGGAACHPLASPATSLDVGTLLVAAGPRAPPLS